MELCHKYQKLIQTGDYYRLFSWSEAYPFDSWEVAAKDGSEALVTCVQVLGRAGVHSRLVRVKGLDAEASYRLEGTDEIYAGDELEHCGFAAAGFKGDFQSKIYHFIRQ